MKEREEILQNFRMTLEFLQERHGEIMKEKEEKYQEICKEKMDVEDKVKLMVNSYEHVIQENKKIQKKFNKKFKVFFFPRRREYLEAEG